MHDDQLQYTSQGSSAMLRPNMTSMHLHTPDADWQIETVCKQKSQTRRGGWDTDDEGPCYIQQILAVMQCLLKT